MIVILISLFIVLLPFRTLRRILLLYHVSYALYNQFFFAVAEAESVYLKFRLVVQQLRHIRTCYLGFKIFKNYFLLAFIKLHFTCNNRH